MNDVEEMPVYHSFMELAKQVEKLTRGFASDFRWLRIQALRSSESVCANMTEGFYAQYSTEYLQSLYRCRREARETVTHIRYAMEVGVLDNTAASSLMSDYEDALHQLACLISSIDRKIAVRGKSKYQAREESDIYETSLEPFAINHQPSTIRPQPFPIRH